MGHPVGQLLWERFISEFRGQYGQIELLDWFDNGRSGSPVARIMRLPHADHLILKFCPTHERAHQLVAAQQSQDQFVEQHLAKVDGNIISLDADACAVFMHVAGGDLQTFRSMADIRDDAPSDVDYAAIIKSVISDWNGGRPEVAMRTARSVVSSIVGQRRDKVLRWIRSTPDLATSAPVSFLTGDAGRLLIKDLLIGKAHGDLSGRNILIPTVPFARSKDFQLIDYDHFADDDILARDPMHLLVALAIDDLRRQPHPPPDLIEAIVDPYQKRNYRRVGDMLDISREIREGCVTSFATSKGLGGQWAQQCLLALVGVALVHIGRDLPTSEPEVARRWCFDLAAAAAEKFRRDYPKLTADVPRRAVSASRPPIIDRFFEQEALTDRLAYGPFGVLSVQGGIGVGKSKLVDVVVGRMGADGSGHRRPRFHRHYATADRRFDLRTLVALISGGSEPEGGSSLVRLEQLLKQLTEPVIIAVNSAEHLLDDDHLWLVDPELADAFAMLNADPDHRVSVVLETRRGDVLAGEVSWPSDDTVAVEPLPQKDFLDLLRDMDPHDGKLRLSQLSLDEQRTLYECADGIPRVGELLYATVSQARIPLRVLLVGLSAHRHNPVAYLLGTLVGEMHKVDREVLQALAVLRTQVPGEAVQMLVNGAWHPDQVEQSLTNLVDDHLVRSERRSFFLPSPDAGHIRRQMSEEERKSRSFRAAKALKALERPHPKNVDDLRYHLAEVQALLTAQLFPLAYQVITAIDDHLRVWNSSPLLLRQRLDVRDRLDVPELEQHNENALGGIYVALGAIDEASDAYGNALALAGGNAPPQVLARLHTNLAAMNWAASRIGRAQSHFEYALSKATEAGDLIARMGSLNGMADCHRRRGEFTAAIERASQAYDMCRAEEFETLPDAPTEGIALAVGLAVRLSRWHAEQAEMQEARDWLNELGDTAGRGGAWHRATHLDASADLQLFERPADGPVEGLIETARRAVELAFEVRDPVVLLQARTTLCMAHLYADEPAKAAKYIARAVRHRAKGRHLVVPALHALTTRLTGDLVGAERIFNDLLKAANERIAADKGWRITVAGERIEVGRGDFGARHFQGFARCGLVLTDRLDIDSAIDSFRMTDLPTRPHAPGLTDRLAFLLERLDKSAPRSGLLQPAIEALRAS